AGMDQHLAQGTSLLVMVPAGLTGALTHYKLGNVHANIVLGLIAGAMAGGYLGAITANLLPALTLTIVFCGIGIWMGVRYIR
ncbi:MAG: permease, partial [Desulfobacca sp.]|nr:permease [Desulfobacca sp.]